MIGFPFALGQLVRRYWNYLPWAFGLLFWLIGMHQEAVISVGIGVLIMGPPGDVSITRNSLKVKMPACIVILFIALFDPFGWLA